jgi:hypothetical protein
VVRMRRSLCSIGRPYTAATASVYAAALDSPLAEGLVVRVTEEGNGR